MLGLNKGSVIDAIRSALAEDIGPGDITTLSTVPPGARARALFMAKEPGVVAGLLVAQWVFEELEPNVEFLAHMPEGGEMGPGDRLAEVSGSASALLMGERVALNYLQRMSGIATLTRSFVNAVSHTRARIVDTRKTTPGLRALEKYAVRAGGGGNHRMGLFDSVLIKDNHIVAAGGITRAVAGARAAAPYTARIEVECETRDQVLEALECDADIIMLDNMTAGEMRSMVALIGGRAIVEASGNMDESKIAAVAETGVDIISAGKLTRGAVSLDISLDLELLQ